MYEKHIIVCKIHNTSLRDIETDAIDVYDTKTLSKLVITLYKKVDDLEKKLKNNVPDKNINIINWLNENERPDFSFKEWIKTINIDEATKEILKNKISNAIDSVKYEVPENNGDIRENFSSRYYKSNGLENRNVDILFLILLGLFIIFILDKK